MPIIIKDFNWRQTIESVILRISLKGLCLKTLDVFNSERYIKVHSPPFLFEVVLWTSVVDAESKCTITNEEVVFHLIKEVSEHWPQLSAEISRQEALLVKRKAIEDAQSKAEQRKKDLAVKKDERQKAAVREQISLHTQELDLIKLRKEEARATALEQMGWSRPKSSVTITELSDEPLVKTAVPKKIDKEIFKAAESSKSAVSLIPQPRQSGQITVSFTARVFPTPCRESKLPEEEEWLSKQAEARRRTGFVAEDLTPQEQDPIWLCDKAQSFYDVGNYLGAVSAYTHALTLNSHLYQLYSGRAMAQLALGNHQRAVADASKALELLTPAVALNAEARARCLLCRGRGLAALGMKSEALGELRAAQRLMPECLEIQTTLEQLEESIESEEETG